MTGQDRSVEASAEKCQARCAATLGCSHFSFWETDGGCHLKDAASTPSIQPDVISGRQSCKAQCFEGDSKYDPLNMADQWRTEEVSAVDCQARCNKTSVQ